MHLFPYTRVMLSCILAVLMLSGCYRQWVSVGDMPVGSGWHSEQRVAISIHRHSDYVVEVSSSNNSRAWNPARKVFALSVRFYLKETGFQFNPQQVHLLIPGVQELEPQWIEMVANAAGWESAWQCGYGPRKNNPEQVLLGHEVCFEYYFPISPPSPDASFALRIGGLSRDGRSVEIPEVHFKKGSFWVWDFLGR